MAERNTNLKTLYLGANRIRYVAVAIVVVVVVVVVVTVVVVVVVTEWAVMAGPLTIKILLSLLGLYSCS